MAMLIQEMTATRRFAGWTEDMARRYATWRAYRETVEQLGHCSARELDDLGIAPGDIRDVAWRATFGTLR